ncbi:MAG TPA: iron ABC transporter permease [Firmicutes bacterium]|nr:iron ABC transporter permease [Candidatus Fermentithermobacillaceae bacterium]
MTGLLSGGRTGGTIKKGWVTAGLVACLAAVIFLGVGLGAVRVPPREVFTLLFKGPVPGDPESQVRWEILWRLRLPRVLMGLLVGFFLGIAGAVMQGLFRNPMADPYILGVSSGASLGAVLGIVFGVGRALGAWALPLPAFLGAFCAMVVVYSLATWHGRTELLTLLLSGIALSSMISSGVALIMVLFRQRTEEIVFWTMGGLARSSWSSVRVSLPYVLVLGTLIWLLSRPLDVLAFGEETAFHLGLDVERSKRLALFGASLITAQSVAFTGPIGFVGLVVPHAVRLIIGPAHRWLVPCSGLAGASLLVLSDLLARTLVPPAEIPVGVITAMGGAPFFLYLLFQQRKRGRGTES